MAWLLTTVLFFCIIGTLTDAECHCNTAAACAVFPSTPCSQVGDPDRCQQGLYGSHCQRRNIAVGRRATQSTTFIENSDRTGYTYQPYEARYGVDGRATTVFYSTPFTCAHTNIGDQHPTWTVHLNNSNTDKIQHIKLYLRDGFLERNKGMKINVGGQLCFQWSTDRYPPAIADVKCQQALTGNNLTIQTSDYLALCEVQIFVCSDGWFGEDCDKQCHCSLNPEVCDKITGQCMSGCAPGYKEADCQTGSLHPSSRKRTDTCLQQCPDGRYGMYCASQCGNCLDGHVCNKSTGMCPRGCAEGWMNDTCVQLCEDGWYGRGCTSACGHCINGTVCDKSNGICGSGCDGEYSGARCEQCPATSGHSNQVVPVAATLGTLLVLALIALLAAIINNRSYRSVARVMSGTCVDDTKQCLTEEL